jgi:hypothetical protein
MKNALESLNKFRRDLLLERLENAAENYISDLSASDMANELLVFYTDTMAKADIEELANFVNTYGDD